MKSTIAKHTWITDNHNRLDASFHLSEGRLIKNKIENSPFQKLSIDDLSNDIFYGGRAKRTYVKDSNTGIPFIGSSDMLKSDLSGVKYISKKHTKNIKNYLLEEGWILISRSGTIGNTAYVNKNLVGKAASEHIIRIVPNSKVQSGYLYAFLSSRYGYGLMTQGTFGAVIQHIEPDFLANINVPILSKSKQEEIHQLIIDAAQLRVEANRLLEEAENYFYENINISKEELKKLNSPHEADISNTFKINSKELLNLTLRARNYGNRLKTIVSVLEKKENDSLCDVVKIPIAKGGRYKRVEVNRSSPNAIELLNQGDIFNLKPKGKVISKKYIDDLSSQTTKRNMILIPAVGTLGENEIFGRAIFSYGYLEDKVISEHLLRIVPDEDKIDPGYLFIVLKSKLWFRILRSIVYGTNLLYFLMPIMNKMPIPRLDKSIESEIGEKVTDA